MANQIRPTHIRASATRRTEKRRFEVMAEDPGSASEIDPSGERLYSRLHELRKPLSLKQVRLITQYLDDNADPQVYATSRKQPYLSKDFRIGRLRPTPAERILEDDPGMLAVHMPFAERWDSDTQRNAFEFVKSDAQIEIMLKSCQAWIAIAGMSRKVYHYQLYAAFVMLITERGPCRGIIEADRMGLGKVYYPISKVL